MRGLKLCAELLDARMPKQVRMNQSFFHFRFWILLYRAAGKMT